MENQGASLRLTDQKRHTYYMQAVSAASNKIINIWKGNNFDIQKELLFPNDKPNNSPYSVDAYFVDDHILVEIDGSPYHKNIERDQIRDNHIEGIASSTGHDCYVIRLPLEIPQNLIYGNLQGKRRQDVKAKYNDWLENWARVELASLPNRLRLAKLSKT